MEFCYFLDNSSNYQLRTARNNLILCFDVEQYVALLEADSKCSVKYSSPLSTQESRRA